MSDSLSFFLSWDITIKNKVSAAKKSPYQWHMPQQHGPAPFLRKIMLDKPQIREKLTNAWHLLNIHYSDTSLEFQKAERMLNQHSYSQSEPRHHIAARLDADENGTLGPDFEERSGALTRELCKRVSKRERKREDKGVTVVVLRGEGCSLFERFFRKRGICPPSGTASNFEAHVSHMRCGLNGILKRGVIITPKFIHIIAQTDTEDSHTPSLFFSPCLHRLSGDKGWKHWPPPLRPWGSQARPQRASHHFQF